MALDLEFVLEMDHQQVPLDLEMEQLFVGKTKLGGEFHKAKSRSIKQRHAQARRRKDGGHTNITPEK
ncbi:hypothetical protein NL676_031988 [Syzygium grande]|nr:hypothetical protein NL676_031988 [Syzygium grande]